MIKNIFRFISIIFISIISLTYVHELGHSLFATIYGCNAKSLIYDNAFVAYTLAECEKHNEVIALGGLILSLLFSLLFLSFGKEIFLISVSLSFVLALEDIKLFINPLYVLIFSSFLSFVSYFLLFENFSRRKLKNFL